MSSNGSSSQVALFTNDMIFNLPESGLRQRIVNVYGKTLNQKLLSWMRKAVSDDSGFRDGLIRQRRGGFADFLCKRTFYEASVFSQSGHRLTK